MNESGREHSADGEVLQNYNNNEIRPPRQELKNGAVEDPWVQQSSTVQYVPLIITGRHCCCLDVLLGSAEISCFALPFMK